MKTILSAAAAAVLMLSAVNVGAQEKAALDEELEEIIVTGTHIRGAGAAGAPLTSYSRADISASGAITTEQFLNTLPQNFGGGVSEDTSATFVPADGRVNVNLGMGTGINLRGLGSDATLVLLNGHRLSQTGAGNFVDVSQIPLSAIERIDVLTDGTSAIYGSDAVAGVVNIVLSNDLQGAQTRLRYGAVTTGDSSRFGVGQSVGSTFENGSLLIAYDYSEQDSLNREDRPFASVPVGDLLPERKNHNALLNGLQELGNSNVRLRYDATFSKRTSDFVLPESAFSESADRRRQASATNYSGYTALDFPLHASWTGQLGALYSSAHVESEVRFIHGDSVSRQDYENTLASGDLLFNGSLFEFPGGGTVRASIGASYRQEELVSDRGDSFAVNADRRVTAGFAELFLPLIEPDTNSSSSQVLEVSLALRHEDYSDLGTTTNPKIGVLWSPVRALSLRTTYGRSFRAPAFDESTDVLGTTVLIDFPDPDFDNTSLTLISVGTKDGLRPERSKTWTAGLTYEPSLIENTRVTLDYFQTDFIDRILTPSNSPFTILADESIYSPIIIRDPTPEQIAAVMADPGGNGFIDATDGADPQDATVIIDNRSQNIGSTKIRGLDFALIREIAIGRTQWRFSLTGTRFFDFENQITPSAEAVDIVGTTFNPPELRVRAGAAATHGRWSGGLFVNYVPSYDNDLGLETASVDSWTTVDGSLTYDVGQNGGGMARGLSLHLSIENLLNENPPSVIAAGDLLLLPVGYDAANASPLRRFISLELNKRF